MYTEITSVCSEIHIKHINLLCGQNVEFIPVKLRGTYNNHWTLMGCGPGSVVCIATGYRLDGPGIESRWEARFSALV